MSPLPLPIRLAAGLAAVALERARKLPQDVSEWPMTAVSQALQISMRVQQRITELAIKGDEALAGLREPEEDPPWAVFDEDLPAPSYLRPRTEVPPADETTDDYDLGAQGTTTAEERSWFEAIDEVYAQPDAHLAPAEALAETPAQAAAAPPAQAAARPPTEAAAEAQPDTPAEAATEAPRDTPAEAPAEMLAEPPAEAPPEAAAEPPAQAPPETPAEAAAETPPQTPAEAAAETPPDTPPEAPHETPAAAPTLETADTSARTAQHEDPNRRTRGHEPPDTSARSGGHAGQRPGEGAVPAVLPSYPGLSLASVRGRLRVLTAADLEELLGYERDHGGRPEFVRMLTNRIATVRRMQ